MTRRGGGDGTSTRARDDGGAPGSTRRGAGARVEAVLFDAAGTLIRPREPVGETYARVARAHGAQISAWRLEDAFRRVHDGRSRETPMAFPDAAPERIPALERAWWRELVRGTFLAADSAVRPRDFDALFAALWDAFADPSAWRAMPGAREALAALRGRGVATAVVSNFDARLPALLEGLGLAALLDAVVLPLHARACKPDPAIFCAGLAALGAEAARSVYVGDHAALDLDAARAVGMRAIDATGLATLSLLPNRILDETTSPEAASDPDASPPETPA